MSILTPVLSSSQVAYNPGIAETFSWIPVTNSGGRPLYAKATYAVNASSRGFTLCESRTSGNPSFTPNQILIHNDSNSDVKVRLTLMSGMSCDVPVGKNTTANHILCLNLAVSAVINYSGCDITFFA
jgi:hypothetical protein